MEPNYDKEIKDAQVSGKIVTRISSVFSPSRNPAAGGNQVTG